MARLEQQSAIGPQPKTGAATDLNKLHLLRLDGRFSKLGVQRRTMANNGGQPVLVDFAGTHVLYLS